MHDILIVDDTRENIRLLQSILKDEGYQTRVAINGKMALESVKITPPTIILMDIDMPVMDGIETCIAIKSMPELSSIPILFISAYSDIEKINQAFKSGGCDYISKPFNKLEVLIRIKNQVSLLESNRQQLQVKMLSSTIELIAGITHEINNPLGTSLTANSFIASKLTEFKGQVDAGVITRKNVDSYLDEAKEASALMDKSLSKVSHLIDNFNLLLLGQNQDISRFDVKEQLLLIAESNKRTLSQAGASYTINGDDLNIAAPFDSFTQLFKGLFDNATQHAYPNDQKHNIEISVEKMRDTVCIQFKDNGIGMASDALEKLFTPFYTTARTGDHLGLSATLIFNLVTVSLKGKITAMSTVEHGLCYEITLPLNA